MKFSIFLTLILFTLNLTAQKLYEYDVEKQIKKLGIELTTPAKPAANYVGAVKTGNLIRQGRNFN